jgi:hypothetical protein
MPKNARMWVPIMTDTTRRPKPFAAIFARQNLPDVRSRRI